MKKEVRRGQKKERRYQEGAEKGKIGVQEKAKEGKRGKCQWGIKERERGV